VLALRAPEPGNALAAGIARARFKDGSSFTLLIHEGVRRQYSSATRFAAVADDVNPPSSQRHVAVNLDVERIDGARKRSPGGVASLGIVAIRT
jgi:hypothetical protein